MQEPTIRTLGELKKSGYSNRTVKQEIRENLITHIRNHTNPFSGIIGYEETVIPDVERALLSRHNILFLGLRGQAKTRMARDMVNLLDEWLPVVERSEINDNPFAPISHFGRTLVAEMGDATPIRWLHRTERYGEKLATPDVSVADLIGDVDPIKAANLRLSFADERAIHFGIIPRSHRGIFVINELPDLQARIQVALFNILQEGDVQIRGFKLRLPLDILFVFTANPEDYTNRGSIVTPLKDRIESQIITHYPKTAELSAAITAQEADLLPQQTETVIIPELCRMLVEQIAIEARKSEYVDQKSGVSARLTISAYENLVSTAERRAIREGVKNSMARITDFSGVLPAITGKIELVYEGEQEGTANVGQHLINLAIRSLFVRHFPDPQSFKRSESAGGQKKRVANPYQPIIDWFAKGNTIALLQEDTDEVYHQKLHEVDGLYAAVARFHPAEEARQQTFLMEFLLFGLAEYSLISKKGIEASGFAFGDILGSMLNMNFGTAGIEEDDE